MYEYSYSTGMGSKNHDRFPSFIPNSSDGQASIRHYGTGWTYGSNEGVDTIQVHLWGQLHQCNVVVLGAAPLIVLMRPHPHRLQDNRVGGLQWGAAPVFPQHHGWQAVIGQSGPGIRGGEKFWLIFSHQIFLLNLVIMCEKCRFLIPPDYAMKPTPSVWMLCHGNYWRMHYHHSFWHYSVFKGFVNFLIRFPSFTWNLCNYILGLAVFSHTYGSFHKSDYKYNPTTHPSTQCATVRTNRSLMRAPPQKPSGMRTNAIQGNSWRFASVPPTILTLVPWRPHPENHTHVQGKQEMFRKSHSILMRTQGQSRNA